MNDYDLALFLKRRRYRSGLADSKINNIVKQRENYKKNTKLAYDTPLLKQITQNIPNQQQSINTNINIPTKANDNQSYANTIVRSLTQNNQNASYSTSSAAYTEGPMHFTMEDFLNAGREKHTKESISPEHYKNAENLINKINQIGQLLDVSSTLSSGYRTAERQRQIYAEKGKNPIMNSLHLTGHALDINDPTGRIKRQIQSNKQLLNKAKELGLYFENFNATPNWVHIQDMPPKITGRQIWSADNLLQMLN
jgi:uncharacterized protein YcbK (DUF882 family)